MASQQTDKERVDELVMEYHRLRGQAKHEISVVQIKLGHLLQSMKLLQYEMRTPGPSQADKKEESAEPQELTGELKNLVVTDDVVGSDKQTSSVVPETMKGNVDKLGMHNVFRGAITRGSRCLKLPEVARLRNQHDESRGKLAVETPMGGAVSTGAKPKIASNMPKQYDGSHDKLVLGSLLRGSANIGPKRGKPSDMSTQYYDNRNRMALMKAALDEGLKAALDDDQKAALDETLKPEQPPNLLLQYNNRRDQSAPEASVRGAVGMGMGAKPKNTAYMPFSHDHHSDSVLSRGALAMAAKIAASDTNCSTLVGADVSQRRSTSQQQNVFDHCKWVPPVPLDQFGLKLNDFLHMESIRPKPVQNLFKAGLRLHRPVTKPAEIEPNKPPTSDFLRMFSLQHAKTLTDSKDVIDPNPNNFESDGSKDP